MIALYVLAYLYCFLIAYITIMGIYRAHLTKRLSKPVLILLSPFVALGYVGDVIANFGASFLFMDAPSEWMFTNRLIRYKAGDDGWRKTVAEYICDGLLDVFDPTGDHC
jgi:hypothetical protein